MRFLLDTHCWLWLQQNPERISPGVLQILANPQHTLYFSAASSWEIGIKWALGKLPLPSPPEIYVPSRMARYGVVGLAIEHRHTLAQAALPSHHRDPFDRLLLAQAKVDELTLVTVDRALERYEGIQLLWA